MIDLEGNVVGLDPSVVTVSCCPVAAANASETRFLLGVAVPLVVVQGSDDLRQQLVPERDFEIEIMSTVSGLGPLNNRRLKSGKDGKLASTATGQFSKCLFSKTNSLSKTKF